MFYIIGLGNPGEEYENSRHNTGRMAVQKLSKDLKINYFEFNKKANALVAKGTKMTIVLPETFMNKSGNTVSFFLKPRAGKDKSQQNLIVVHDDLDLPIGTLKISYNKGVGGHRGLDSVVKAVKTLEFVRVRIGISPATTKGQAKKPGANLSPKAAEKAVIDFILGKFKPKETEILKKVFKKASEALQSIVTDGRAKAMNIYNS